MSDQSLEILSEFLDGPGTACPFEESTALSPYSSFSSSFSYSSIRHFLVWHDRLLLKRERHSPHFENDQAVRLPAAHQDWRARRWVAA
jgi:hypothetical protein